MGFAERTTPQTRPFPNQTDRNINLQSVCGPSTLCFSPDPKLGSPQTVSSEQVSAVL